MIISIDKIINTFISEDRLNYILNLDFLLSTKNALTVSLVSWLNVFQNFLFLIVAGRMVSIWQPNFFIYIQLYGSLILAQSISAFFNFFAISILSLNSATRPLPVSPALPANIKIITLVCLLTNF